jgi:hypothetical protein
MNARAASSAGELIAVLLVIHKQTKVIAKYIEAWQATISPKPRLRSINGIWVRTDRAARIRAIVNRFERIPPEAAGGAA